MPEEYEKYTKFALNAAIQKQKELKWCPTPDCNFAFVTDPPAEGNREAGQEFNCPQCKVHICLRCEQPWHEG